jgi:hypothetical protein
VVVVLFRGGVGVDGSQAGVWRQMALKPIPWREGLRVDIRMNVYVCVSVLMCSRNA